MHIIYKYMTAPKGCLSLKCRGTVLFLINAREVASYSLPFDKIVTVKFFGSFTANVRANFNLCCDKVPPSPLPPIST